MAAILTGLDRARFRRSTRSPLDYSQSDGLGLPVLGAVEFDRTGWFSALILRWRGKVANKIHIGNFHTAHPTSASLERFLATRLPTHIRHRPHLLEVAFGKHGRRSGAVQGVHPTDCAPSRALRLLQSVMYGISVKVGDRYFPLVRGE